MQIEAGKYYETRDGRKVGPIEYSKRGYATKPYPFQSPQLKFISSDGMVNSGTCFDPQSDLIALWQEPTSQGPVRTKTVTTREVVDGVYGRISVRGGYGRDVVISLTDRVGKTIDGGNFDATELRAAALVLTQLAEALEK